MVGIYVFSFGRLNWLVMYSFLIKDVIFLERISKLFFVLYRVGEGFLECGFLIYDG